MSLNVLPGERRRRDPSWLRPHTSLPRSRCGPLRTATTARRSTGAGLSVLLDRDADVDAVSRRGARDVERRVGHRVRPGVAALRGRGGLVMRHSTHRRVRLPGLHDDVVIAVLGRRRVAHVRSADQRDRRGRRRGRDARQAHHDHRVAALALQVPELRFSWRVVVRCQRVFTGPGARERRPSEMPRRHLRAPGHRPGCAFGSASPGPEGPWCVTGDGCTTVPGDSGGWGSPGGPPGGSRVGDGHAGPGRGHRQLWGRQAMTRFVTSAPNSAPRRPSPCGLHGVGWNAPLRHTRSASPHAARRGVALQSLLSRCARSPSGTCLDMLGALPGPGTS